MVMIHQHNGDHGDHDPTWQQAELLVVLIALHSTVSVQCKCQFTIDEHIERWWSAQGLACRKERVGDL